ncbi:MAG: hypothetical protein IJY76_05670, partial [Anaerotignum sp.]|nr:hypothetical protein [Anaerotignum sp.]
MNERRPTKNDKLRKNKEESGRGKMKMKKLMMIMLTALLLLAGCGSNTAAPQNKLEEILANGKLVLATSPDYAPQEFINPNETGQDQYVGSDI